MAIEFRCTTCQRLLRTQDDAGGKQAKCPECGTVLTVPAKEADQPAEALPPLPEDRPASPFGPVRGEANPFATGRPAEGGTQNPYQSPTDYAPGPVYVASAGGAIVPTRIDLGDIFSRTWTILKGQYGMTLAVFVLVWLIGFVANIGLSVVGGVSDAALGDPVAVAMVNFLGMLIYWLFYFWLNAGASICYLKIARGQPAAIGEIFSGGPYFVRLLLATILFFLILWLIGMVFVIPASFVGWILTFNGADPSTIGFGALAGFAIALIPGTAAALGLFPYYYVILDQNVRPVESLSLAWKITSGNKLTLFAIWALASVGALVITVLTCGIGGLFLVAPFLSLLFPVIYLAMTGQPTAERMYRPM
jgi:uncharacterized membrane protein/phage FluMu protein Com